MRTRDPAVFLAIADSTRRALLDLLLGGETTASDLCSLFEISQQAVSQHLQLLRRVGLVTARKDGRFQKYRLTAEPIRAIFEWAAKYEPYFDPFGHAWSTTFITTKQQRQKTRAPKRRVHGR